jgi:hypothetical protein
MRTCPPICILAFGLAACAGDARLTNPAVTLLPNGIRTTVADGGEAPGFATAADVPPEYAGAQIISASTRVDWSGSTALAYSSMRYFGNRGEQMLDLQVLHDYSTVGSTSLQQTDEAFFPSERVMGTPLQYAVPNPCGQVANLAVRYTARVVVVVNYSWAEWSADAANRFAEARQEDCEADPPPCDASGGDNMMAFGPGGVPVDSYFYDPYAPGEETATPSDCAGNGGEGDSGGSGESFASMCGSLRGTLYYDYGCLEQWDAAKNQWVTVWCGTYAVCET